jgi:hypothetical protein
VWAQFGHGGEANFGGAHLPFWSQQWIRRTVDGPRRPQSVPSDNGVTQQTDRLNTDLAGSYRIDRYLKEAQ